VATISLSDASFRNAQNNNADFRIQGEVYVKSVKFSRGVPDPNTEPVPVTSGSSYSEFKGKSVAGYQAWFTASNGGSWGHWGGNPPAPGVSNFEVYPDMRDYEESEKYQSGFADLGNGEAATLFSSAEVIDTHFEWMNDAGIDGVALQRFISGVGKVVTTVQSVKSVKVKNEAEANERIFYICYDISGDAEDWAERIKFDWVFNIEQAYDMVSPWTPGRYRDLSGVNNFKNDKLVPDKAYCDANGMDYMPVLFPGFAWSTWNSGEPNSIPRLAGEFLWRQATNIHSLGLKNMYFAMFDEYDEGTALMKGATDWSMIPTDQYFLTHAADGIWVSSDFYLRVAGAATTMLQSSATPSVNVPVSYSEGPVFFRNSFEKRYTEWVRNEVPGNGVFNLDPCFYKDKQLSISNVSGASCKIEKNTSSARSGEYIVKMSGSPTSDTKSEYSYLVSELKIPVVEGLALAYWKKNVNSLGRYVGVDLLFSSGKRLSESGKQNPADGIGADDGQWSKVTCMIGEGDLIGDVITGMAMVYDHPASGASFEARIDDVLLSTDIGVSIEDSRMLSSAKEKQIGVGNGILNFKDFSLESQVQIYNVGGQLISGFELRSHEVVHGLKRGVYVVVVRNKNELYVEKLIF
jgi:hypothetical protein